MAGFTHLKKKKNLRFFLVLSAIFFMPSSEHFDVSS